MAESPTWKTSSLMAGRGPVFLFHSGLKPSQFVWNFLYKIDNAFLSADNWMKKMWCICAMEYYSVIKKNKLLPLAATWEDMESIVQDEKSQRDKERYYMIFLLFRI